jgi:hypothetical protein
MAQLAPAASVDPHPLICEKPLPVAAMLLMFSVDPPVL